MNEAFIMTDLLMLAMAWLALRRLENNELFKQTAILMLGGTALTAFLGVSLLFDFLEAQPVFRPVHLVDQQILPELAGLAFLCVFNLFLSFRFFRIWQRKPSATAYRNRVTG